MTTPNGAERLIALGAYFAAEQQFRSQIAAMAVERDQALARASAAEQKLQPTQVIPEPDKDYRLCLTHRTDRWACLPFDCEKDPCQS